jgi:predicted RNA-binding protein with PIN domain
VGPDARAGGDEPAGARAGASVDIGGHGEPAAAAGQPEGTAVTGTGAAAAGAGSVPVAGTGGRAGGRQAAAERAGAARRVPLPLPPGILDDAPEAADHLVRQPGVLLLVDGYNTTLTDLDWSALPIAEQRQRLVDALRELAARTGVAVEVVFDGAEGGGPHLAAGPGRHGVRVVFSAPDEEADDWILRRVAALPPARPVVVASSDRRVREGAARLGANVVAARQLMSLLRARP